MQSSAFNKSYTLGSIILFFISAADLKIKVARHHPSCPDSGPSFLSVLHVYGTRSGDTTQLHARIYFQAPGNKKSFQSSAWLEGDKARMIVQQADLNSTPRLGEHTLQYRCYYGLGGGGVWMTARDMGEKQVTLQTQQNLVTIRRRFSKRSMNSDNILRGRKFNTLFGWIN